jgi:Fe-S-cluster containining protein
MPEIVERPLWRSFEANQLRAAAKHARAGGISVVKGSEPKQRWRMLGDAGPPGEDLPLLVDWAIRAIEAPRWGEIVEGPAKGCVEAPIARGWRERVSEWIARDLAFEGATSHATFDCVKCAACCRDNKVVLDEQDLARFRDGGRVDLLKRTSKKGIIRLLPLVRTKDKSCIHLGKDLLCTIYEVRPNMCREFPAGTEQCMTSREDIWDTPFPPGR